MTINTEADIAGDNAVHALAIAGSPLQARRIWITATGSSNARFGDIAHVGAARGSKLTADVQSTFSASDADRMDTIPLAQVGIYVPTGTTITVSWGQ